jgi:hypothetical protein
MFTNLTNIWFHGCEYMRLYAKIECSYRKTRVHRCPQFSKSRLIFTKQRLKIYVNEIKLCMSSSNSIFLFDYQIFVNRKITFHECIFTII